MTDTADGDPRIERTRRVVLKAAAELIGECGFGSTSIEAISERCGVARSTIYRHWPDRSELLVESVRQRMGLPHAAPTGDIRADLVAIYRHLGALLCDPDTGPLAAHFVAESTSDPEIAALHVKLTESRRAETSGLIQEAVDRGDLSSETDAQQMADDLAAGIFYRALIRHEQIDEEWVERHVDRWISTYSD
jgi:AcrR family transcriptional regulator